MKTPIRIEDISFLVDADHELICDTVSATPAELEHIVKCVNAYPALLECAEALKACQNWLREYNVQMGPDTGLHMLQEQTESALGKLKEMPE